MRKSLSMLMLSLLVFAALAFIPSLAKAAPPVDHFLVLTNVGCSQFNIATDTDCWSATDGGAGGFPVPTIGDRAVLTLNSDPTGTIPAFFDGNMFVDGWCARNACSGFGTFVGSITLDPFHLFVGVSGGTCDPALCAFDTAGTFIMNGAGSLLTVTDGDFLNTAGTFTAFNDGGGGEVDMVATVPGERLMSLQGPSTDFDHLSFSGPAATTDGFRVQLGDITANFVVISQTSVTLDSPHQIVLNVAAFPADGFVRFHMGGLSSFTMSGLAVLQAFAFDYGPALGGPNILAITSWLSNSNMNMKWTQTMTEDTPGPYNVGFSSLNPGTTYNLQRDGTTIDTATADADGAITFSETNSGWSGTHVVAIVTPVGGGGITPVPPNPLLSRLPGAPYCPTGSGTTIILTDTRREAVNGILWQWLWGDGQQTSTSNSTAMHTYAVAAAYDITVRIQDVSGRVDTFSGRVNLANGGCSVLNAAYIAGPYLLALLILVAFALGLQIVTGKRPKLRQPLIVALIVLLVIIGAFVYYGWPLELPGHIKLA